MTCNDHEDRLARLERFKRDLTSIAIGSGIGIVLTIAGSFIYAIV